MGLYPGINLELGPDPDPDSGPGVGVELGPGPDPDPDPDPDSGPAGLGVEGGDPIQLMGSIRFKSINNTYVPAHPRKRHVTINKIKHTLNHRLSRFRTIKLNVAT
jgi:hypothetical protein